MKHWLIKTEPTSYSIDDLKRDKKTEWDGVRNYQARNYMRDEMKVGDICFVYHSSCEVPGIYGIAKVCSTPHADESAFDKRDSHFDPKSKKESPTWILVDVCFVKKLKKPLSLEAIKQDGKLAGITVARRGQRLSVMPIDRTHGKHLEKILS